MLNPIFVFSPVQRSGSTLVQRLLNSTEDLGTGRPVVVWGEHGKGPKGLVTHLLEAWKGFKHQWECSGEAQNKQRIDGVGDFWMANMCPFKDTVRDALRGFFLSLYGNPKTGPQGCEYVRWGFKEVRYGEAEVRFLASLFPDAVFVFVVRSPFTSIASYLGTGWKETNPREMAQAWSTIVPFYLKYVGEQHHNGKAFWVSYEHLDETTAAQLLVNLGLRVKTPVQNILGRVIGHSPEQVLEPAVESMIEKICGPAMSLVYGDTPPARPTGQSG